MITVQLYGIFKQLCNNTKLHSFYTCRTLKQLLSALKYNYPKLYRYAYKHHDDLMYIKVNNRFINSEEALTWVLFDRDVVTIVPSTEGSGEDLGRVVGVVLMIVGVFLMLEDGGTTFMYGMTLFMAGAQMTFAASATVAQPSSYEGLDNIAKDSYGFNGSPSNLTTQGNPIPIGYGRIRTGSQVISSSLRAENL